MVAALVFTIPVKVVSTANLRENRFVRAKRTAGHRDAARAHALKWLSPELRAAPAWDVSLVRIGRGQLDDDNLAGAFKAIRDGIAKALGVDDGDRTRVRFFYGQRTGGEPAAEIKIEGRQAG